MGITGAQFGVDRSAGVPSGCVHILSTPYSFFFTHGHIPENIFKKMKNILFLWGYKNRTKKDRIRRGKRCGHPG
jgi:hypothetical protein